MKNLTQGLNLIASWFGKMILNLARGGNSSKLYFVSYFLFNFGINFVEMAKLQRRNF